MIEPDIVFNPASAPNGQINYASAPPPPQPSSQSIGLTQTLKKQLAQQGYTHGMIDALCKSTTSFPLRIWIVDNSGSMNIADGQRIVSTVSSTQVKSVQCTRWKEIQETVEYHIQLAGLLKAPTTFRFLNPPSDGSAQEFSVADKGDDMIGDDITRGVEIIKNSPLMRGTPLAQHVRQIKDQVQMLKDSLNAEGKRIAIILATDGLPSDEHGRIGQAYLNEFTEAMRSLEGLPVWIVVRLCTDQKDVVKFYNNLDANLELSIEVLDNYTDEAKEMYATNPWINYSLALHRMREMGFQHRIFDLLDERSLTISELRDYCVLLFGNTAFDGVPEPEVDFKGFLKALERMLGEEKQQWHPVKNKMKPLVSLKKLNEKYGDGTCTIM